MKESQMYERLLTAGVAAEEAESIVKAFAEEAASKGVENNEEVDVDRLTKAMEGIRDAFESEPAEKTDVESALQEASDIVDAVTKGADALLAEHREQFEALSKGITLLTEEVAHLRSQVSVNGENVVKSLGNAAQALNEPVMRKSLDTYEAVPAPGEHETAAPYNHNDLIAKALDKIRGDVANDTRKAELRKAISLLESGYAAEQVASTYNLSARG